MSDIQKTSDHQQKGDSVVPPPYSTDILAPPQWNGAPGQLLNYSATSTTMTTKYGIFGADTQVVQVMLQPGEFMVTEPGAMLYKGDTIKMTTGIDSCGSCCKRLIAGESMFRNRYTNVGTVPACVTASPSFPAKIIPIDLARSGQIHVNPGLYLAHIGDVHITFKFVKNLAAGCFGGAGFLLLKITGTGTVFLNGGGTIMEKVLAPGEKLLADTDCLVAFAETADYGVKRAGNCLTCCCGGEGLFNTQITGPGLVIVQSMPLPRLRAAIGIPNGQGGSRSGGSGAGAAN